MPVSAIYFPCALMTASVSQLAVIISKMQLYEAVVSMFGQCAVCHSVVYNLWLTTYVFV